VGRRWDYVNVRADTIRVRSNLRAGNTISDQLESAERKLFGIPGE
jgi:hypothetical protein